MFRLSKIEQVLIFPQFMKWSLIAGLVGGLAGTASAFFLWFLDGATVWREHHPWIIYFLPMGGFFIGWAYHRFGRSVERGNNLILDEIHKPSDTIPLRMVPLVLLGTVATHFFGGSAGREGTAVQIGGALADQLSGPLRLTRENRRILLMAGMSAGFSAVFGTPLAGAVFGFEVLAIGRLRYDAILPCFIAALVAHLATLGWGIEHTHYSVGTIPQLHILGVGVAILAGAVFGMMGMLFSVTAHSISHLFKTHVPYPPFRPVIGGLILLFGIKLLGTMEYSGLGISTLVQSFHEHLTPWAFFLKSLFTSITLGSGFKGGEVTPLFYIGATLGNALSCFLPLPTGLLAGMGFVGVFAGAANTPISCILMALELFGSEAGIYMGLACVVSYLFSGHAGIYHAQRIGQPKNM